MGKRIKSTGVIVDASSTASAPVSPAGTVALRAKPDATQFQYSANGGAWADFGGGSGSVRLDQVLDPIDPIVTPIAGVKAFAMGSNQLAFSYTGADAEDCMVIQSATDAPGSGSVLLLRTLGASTTKSPLRIEGRGAFYMAVQVDGKVEIGVESGSTNRLNVYQVNTGADTTGAFHASCDLVAGHTGTTQTGSTIQLSDGGSSLSLTSMTTMSLQLNRVSDALDNGSLNATVLDVGTNLGASTNRVRGINIGLSCVGTMNLAEWEGIRVSAPATVGGPTIVTKRAIITASGAGNVGFGTVTPAVQLHVVGAVQNDQSGVLVHTISKNTDTTDETAQIDLKRAKGTGTTDVIHSNVTGRIMFYGYRLGGYQQHAYIQANYSTDFGAAGVIMIGAGSLATPKARLDILQTDSGGGGVTLYGGASSPVFQVNGAGFIFSHGSTGSIYYKDAAGYFVSLDVDTVADPTTDEGKVLTVTNVSGTLLPRWVTAPGASGGTPGTPVNSLQWNSAGSFAGVTSSVVTGANIELGGSLTLNNTDRKIVASALSVSAVSLVLTEYSGTQPFPVYLQFDKYRGTLASPVDIANLDEIGAIYFRGRRTTIAQQAYIRSEWTTTAQGTLELGAGGTVSTGCLLKLTNNSGLTLQQSSSNYFQITASGFVFSHGTTGAIYYRSAGNLFTALTIGSASQYLKGGTIPSWGGLDAGHITAGVVALANGGTGQALADPGGDRILFWDDDAAAGAGAVGWLTAGTGLTITGTTMTASGSGTPAAPSLTLQYNNAGAFGAVTSSIVSGANIELGGSLTFNNTNRTIVASAVTSGIVGFVVTEYSGTSALPMILQFDKSRGTLASPTDISNLDEIGFIQFRGRRGGVFAQQAYIRTEWTSSAQGTIEIGAGTTSASSYLRLTNNSGLTLQGPSSNLFQITSSGFTFSHGATGAIYYRSAGGLFTALTIGSTSQYLKGGTIPSWGSLDAGHITSGTLALANGGTGQALTDPGADRILFWDDSAGVVTWLTASTGLTITGTSMTASGSTSPAGSGSELQYRNAGAFGAVLSSSVDGSGVVTFGSGATIWTSDSQVLLSYRMYSSNANAPQVSVLKSRGSAASKSGVLAGDGLYVLSVSGQYDSVGQRQGGQLGFDVQSNFSTSSAPTLFKVKTTHLNSITPIDRLILGGSKALVNNTLTDLFTITFASADQLALAGEIQMIFVAKQVAGTVHTFVHRRKVSFAISHNANNDMTVNFSQNTSDNAGGATDDVGLTAISHAINADAATTMGTSVPATPNAIAANTLTYKVLAACSLTLSQLTIYYHILYHGEAQLTLS